MSNSLSKTADAQFIDQNSSASLKSVHIKTVPADWRVYEKMDEDFSGSGEHLYFYVEKESLNTADVVARLAQSYGVKKSDIGYAGLKDKHAITRQWFSIPTPENAWLVDDEQIKCMQTRRHSKKLRRGQHQENYFEIRLRGMQGVSQANLVALDSDFANVFGPQRTSGENFQQAKAWLDAGEWGAAPRAKNRRRGGGKQSARRGWHLSVLRSILFNAVVDKRVEQGNYHKVIDGDVLDDGRPTGPLWGRGRSASSALAHTIEAEALAPFAEICDALEYAGVSQGRRRLVQQPRNFVFELDGESEALVKFSLLPGAYATTLLADKFRVIDESTIR